MCFCFCRCQPTAVQGSCAYWCWHFLNLLALHLRRQQRAVNSSQQWQHGIRGTSQLVTTQCLSCQSVNLPNRYSRCAEGLWRMRRHGPVIAQCTDSVVFPASQLVIRFWVVTSWPCDELTGFLLFHVLFLLLFSIVNIREKQAQALWIASYRVIEHRVINTKISQSWVVSH